MIDSTTFPFLTLFILNELILNFHFLLKKITLHKGFSPQIYLSEHLPLFKMLSEETEFGLRQTLYSPQHQPRYPSKLIVSNADDNLGADESKTLRKNRTKFNPFQVHFDIQ